MCVIVHCKQALTTFFLTFTGIAFPCCISVNNCICHFSPLNSEPDVVLQDGDVVKIDMGAHIDGFIAVVAHTIIVNDGKSKVTGRKADALIAAHLCAEAALRLVKPGNEVSLFIFSLKRARLFTFSKARSPQLSAIPNCCKTDTNKV